MADAFLPSWWRILELGGCTENRFIADHYSPLIADLAVDPDGADLIRTLVIAPECDRVRRRLESAQRQGDIRTDADIDLAIDALIGTALVRTMIVDHPVDKAFSARMVEMVTTALRPSSE